MSTETGDDAVAKMQFEFELADVSQLDSVLSSVYGIESVYEAYRIMPGAAAPDIAIDSGCRDLGMHRGQEYPQGGRGDR